jgi:hypothetical protein
MQYGVLHVSGVFVVCGVCIVVWGVCVERVSICVLNMGAEWV